MRIKKPFILCGSGALLFSGLLVTRAQDVIGPAPLFEGGGPEVVLHPECNYFADLAQFPAVLRRRLSRSVSREP